MTSKERIGCALAIGYIFLRLPLSFALMFLILRHVEATDAMWILFWITIPVGVTLEIIKEVSANAIKESK